MSSATYADLLTYADYTRRIEQAVRDKSYRLSPIGDLVGRYVRWCRGERGLVKDTTVKDYESTLAHMSIMLAHLQPEDVTIDDVRTAIDRWADNEANTRRKVTITIRGFWKWAEDEGHIDRSPASRIRIPKRPEPDARPLPAVDTQLLAVAGNARDTLALLVLLDLGVRKSELTGIMVRDFDLARRTLTVFGKGQRARVLPMRGRIVPAADLYLLTPLEFVGRTPEPEDYLLYSEHRNGSGVYRADPKTRMPSQTAHRWWYYHLQAAGLVGTDVESGMNMHRARHTFATDLRKGQGDLGIVQRMLGHKHIDTTEQYYGHYDLSDLEAAMERHARRNPE